MLFCSEGSKNSLNSARLLMWRPLISAHFLSTSVSPLSPCGLLPPPSQLLEVVDMAMRLEGTNRSAGVHAAGVVISPAAFPLSEVCFEAPQNFPLSEIGPCYAQRACHGANDWGPGSL